MKLWTTMLVRARTDDPPIVGGSARHWLLRMERQQLQVDPYVNTDPMGPVLSRPTTSGSSKAASRRLAIHSWKECPPPISAFTLSAIGAWSRSRLRMDS
jgi:hypothetical protein